MKDIIAKILIDKIGRENVSKFIEDEGGEVVETATISLEALAEEIADTLNKQGYGDTKQAVREFAEMIMKHIGYEIERQANHSKIKAYEKALDLIYRLLAEEKSNG